VVVTPLDTLFTGVEVQATVADNLLQHDFSRRHGLGAAAESLATVVVGGAMALLVARVGLMAAALAGAVAIVAPWVVSVWYWRTTGVFVSPLPVSAGAGSALVLMTMAKFALERRRADREGQDKSTAQRLMVQALLSLTQVRDAETGSHSRRTQQYTRLLAEQLSNHPDFRGYLTPERIELLAALAPLHDIGKVGISDRILHKEGPLTPDELEEMRKHPVYGRDVILTAQRDVGVHDDVILAVAKDIVYSHHEKWDGTGYPEGLRGVDIPIPGRLVALVDVYDASTTRALYCQPLSHRAAVNYIIAAKGTHFDPAVVDAFLRVEARFHAVSGAAAA
jgi:response regulator RpfG family c-di-GMP phosphodiesterase